MGRMLEQDGFQKVEFDGSADVYVINTCSVTENADKECRQLVRRIQRRAPQAVVVISGCYAQLKPHEIAAIPGVDLVLGAAEKFNIAHHLKEISKGEPARICSCDIEDVNSFIPSHSQGGRTRVFLKVQDGCDYNCSFCTIPLARGRSRSNSIDKVMEDLAALESAGAKEIVLTGINLGDFGKGFSGGKKKEETFFELMEAIEERSGISRFRISSIEPNLLEDRMIELVARSTKFMPHFHIPLQSGSNPILASMRRRYKRELYAEKIALIKNLMPHACIGADVITGFPGETAEAFSETMEFLQQLDVSYLHVFTYSERDDTHAIGLVGKVDVSERNDRTRLLRTLSYRKSEEFARSHEGEKRMVLFEGKNKNGMMEGYSDNYIKVATPYRQDWENNIVEWTL